MAKILVTGVSGFIGKKLLHRLHEEYGLINVVALTSKPLIRGSYILHHDYNEEYLRNSFKEFDAFEVLIHAGAFTPKSRLQANDIEGSWDNIRSTKVLLNSLGNVKRIIYLSTLDVYEKTDEKISESTSTKPPSLYGFSKLFCERVVSVFAENSGCDYNILRIGHVYGPGESHYDKIIPTVFKKMINNDRVCIDTDGSELRSFIYIDDVINIIMYILKFSIDLPIVNVVSRKSYSIREIVELMYLIANKDLSNLEFRSLMKGNNICFNSELLEKNFPLIETSIENGLANEWQYFCKLKSQ
jgi:nucleoside-diphosphate-sugar epimerase